METKHQLLERLRHARLAALVVALLGVLLVLFQDVTPLARWSYDVSSRVQPARHLNDTVIVSVDDDTFRELGRELDGTLGRQHLTRLVERCTASGARLVFLDFSFGETNRVDEAFAAALRTNGTVILGAVHSARKSRVHVEGTLLAPVPVLRAAARGWGHLNLPVNAADYGPREFPAHRGEVPPAALRAAEVLGTSPRFSSPRWIRYYGQAEDVFNSARLHRALNALETPDEFFRGKLVFVGASAGADVKDKVVDEFKTPWSLLGGARAPGVFVQATLVNNVLHDDALRRPGLLWEALLAVILGAGSVLLGAALWPRRHWRGVLILWGLLLLASLWLPLWCGAWWNWAVPGLIQIPAAAFLTPWLNLRRLGPKLVFISYRTDDGAACARSLQLGLRERGVNAWLDKSDLPSANYEEEIMAHIRATPNYLLVLTPGVVERAQKRNNMLWQEMDCAGLRDASGATPPCPRPQVVILDAPPQRDGKPVKEGKPLLEQLAAALQQPRLAKFHVRPYDHNNFEGMMLQLLKDLKGVKARPAARRPEV